jgi:molybdenum cofactor biosynthesis enzyme MoaA
LRRRLQARGQTLADAIEARELYFRVSVVGACNLSCKFCHNEGAPTHGKLNASFINGAMRAATSVGFTRVQFSGGEPLLHDDLAEFIRVARGYVGDVGVTTNGTFLTKRLDGLVAAGLRRLHVSLQAESLTEGDSAEWTTPDWLIPTVEAAASGAFKLRLNLPVPADSLGEAERFLGRLTACGISVKVFSLLPEGAVSGHSYPIRDLEEMVQHLNLTNKEFEGAGRIELRGFRSSAGFRCTWCRDEARCKEQSHSLRLGADLVLRPCLATRDWDLRLDWPSEHRSLVAALSDQALLALDYRW